MTVDRSCPTTDPATLTIHFADPDAPQTSPSSSTSAPDASASASATTRTETIDMTHRTNTHILGELLRVTKGMPVDATPAEKELLEKLEEQRLKSLRDSALSKEVRDQKKREEALLAQARGDMS